MASDISDISENERRLGYDPYRQVLQSSGDRTSKVGTTGIPVLINTKIEFSLFVSVALVKFNHQYLYDKYFLYMLQSPLVQKQCAKNTKGVGNKNWVMRDIADTLLVIPPITEQYHIVERIEQLLNVTNRL